eukprot:CAMPEP_0115415020 /NCGR_PEP_ID=MMETSP0271-20121206/22881_1 /TAXON_ID=71861 /ORGANISM="Scrippsiella trochoidea, Strain CCMP3099" /LENGTH=491 /DNA_ID=CAMNT_0002839339 /DNA_START=55 /DNA_END=1530 /DNA_ORIENTATION=+
MPIIEEIDDGAMEPQAQTPFVTWMLGRRAAGASAIDLVQEIGVQAAGAEAERLSEADAEHRLRAFASHPQICLKACEVIRVQCLKLRKSPPFPFAVWLDEQRASNKTSTQVLRGLGLTPSSTVEETVTVLQELESGNKERIQLKQGVHGRVHRYDDEGDALIEFDGISKPQWLFQRDFPKLKFSEADSRWDGLRKLAAEANAWEIMASMLPPPKLHEQPARSTVERIEGVAAAAQLIAKSRRVLVLAGAGISVACGLPTYRDHDVRPAIAEEFGLESGDHVSDIETFRKDPRPWFKWIKNIVPSTDRVLQPSLTHRFIKSLEERGQLLRMYTQNIDALERSAGITRLMECHGSLATATCIHCSEQVLDATQANNSIAAGEIPRCTSCGVGVMKPDVVLFGEPMPSAVMRGLAEDTEAADLLLVLGTSLSVAPCSLVPSLVGAAGNAPRILINREKVGKESDFECFLPGSSDDVVQSLLTHMNFGNEPTMVD